MTSVSFGNKKMFCVIKYIDYEEFRNGLEIEETPSQSGSESENKILLINPDCPIGILRDYISSTLRLSGENADNFELCTEKASLLNTKNCPPTQTGLDILKNKDVYYVVFINKDDQNGKNKLLIPLLHNLSKEYFEFMCQQRKKISSSSKVRKKSSTASITLSTTTPDG